MTSKLAKKYGGPHLELGLTATGGSLDFDCASGSFSAPLRLDANGRFSVPGTYRRGSGVHRPGFNPPTVQTVQYKGQVTGTKMAIRFTLDGDTQRFALTTGSGSLMRCM